MEFNLSNSEVLHFGRLIVSGKHTISGMILNGIDVQRNLRVLVHNSLKMSTQADRVKHRNIEK